MRLNGFGNGSTDVLKCVLSSRRAKFVMGARTILSERSLATKSYPALLK
jgi:hypothetical protein